MAAEDRLVEIELNSAVFQKNLFGLDKEERHQAVETLRKISTLRWDQIYADKGLHSEKISSVRPPKGIASIYSLRINKARRATAYRDGNVMRFLTIAPDHDATYGKK